MKLFASLTALAMVASLGTVHADTPAKIVEDTTEVANDSFSDQRLSDAELSRLLNDVDVDGIARFALGKYAERLNDAEYGDYELAFRSYIRGQMQEHLGRFSGGNVDIIDSTERGAQTIVETKVTKPDGEVMDVNWRLRRSEKGWEIIDIEAMNLWLAIEQRAQFVAEMDQNGGDVEALIATLKTKS